MLFFLFSLHQHGFSSAYENIVVKDTLDLLSSEISCLKMERGNLNRRYSFFKEPLNNKEKCYLFSAISNTATLFLSIPLALYYPFTGSKEIAAVFSSCEFIWTFYNIGMGYVHRRQRHVNYSLFKKVKKIQINHFLEFLPQEEAFLKSCLDFETDNQNKIFQDKLVLYHARQMKHDTNLTLIERTNFANLIKNFIKAGAFLSRDRFNLNEGEIPWIGYLYHKKKFPLKIFLMPS